MKIRIDRDVYISTTLEEVLDGLLYPFNSYVEALLKSQNFKDGLISEKLVLDSIACFRGKCVYSKPFYKLLKSDNYRNGIITEDSIKLILDIYKKSLSGDNTIPLYNVLNVIYRSYAFSNGMFSNEEINEVCEFRSSMELVLLLFKIVAGKTPKVKRISYEDFLKLCNKSKPFRFVAISELLLSESYIKGAVTEENLNVLFGIDDSRFKWVAAFLKSDNYLKGYITEEDLKEILSYDLMRFHMAVNALTGDEYRFHVDARKREEVKRLLDTDYKREIYSFIEEDSNYYVGLEFINKLKLLFSDDRYIVILDIIYEINKLVGSVITAKDRRLVLRLIFNGDTMEDLINNADFLRNNEMEYLNVTYVSMMAMLLCSRIKNGQLIKQGDIGVVRK